MQGWGLNRDSAKAAPMASGMDKWKCTQQLSACLLLCHLSASCPGHVARLLVSWSPLCTLRHLDLLFSHTLGQMEVGKMATLALLRAKLAQQGEKRRYPAKMTPYTPEAEYLCRA